MTKEKMAYYAGFFDGEGYIGYGWRLRVEVRIVNTYLPVLKQLKKDYGGNVYKRSKTPKRHKPLYDWVIVGRDDVEKFIADIYPYLIEKKERVDSILNR